MPDRDPWTTPGEPNSTRYICPLGDWWHDEPNGEPIGGIIGYEARAMNTEALTRQHLETHTLEEWVAAATTLQQIKRGDRAGERGDMARCPACKTTIIRFDPPVEIQAAETELCGAFKPGTYGAGMDVPVCLLEKGHGPDEMHWGVVEYETRWTDGGLEWVGKE